MFLRWSRARRRPARRFPILIVIAILGAITVLGVALRERHRDFPWAKRVGAEIHIGD